MEVDMGRENVKITPKVNRTKMTARDSCAAEERDASPQPVCQSRRRKDMTRNPELKRTLPLRQIEDCRSEHQSSSLVHAQVDVIRVQH